MIHCLLSPRCFDFRCLHAIFWQVFFSISFFTIAAAILLASSFDTFFLSTRLRSKLLTIKNTTNDGLLGAFNSNDKKLSFIELDSNECVKRTKEKEQISDIASTGLYIFSRGRDFVEAAESMLANNLMTNNEYYVSELYNILIKQGKKFEIDLADNFIPLGTPNDIKKFERD